MGIPFLHISSDYSSADVGQMRTRVEAFLESIQDNYRIEGNSV
jgi:benzoyl-CoA reductase/2-hydroxyglutaryl-CoA dehydratase subunit BcrC/BadD/HgdB